MGSMLNHCSKEWEEIPLLNRFITNWWQGKTRSV